MSTAVPVFVELMKTMNQPAKSFTKPAGIVEAKINKTSQEHMGKLAPEGAEKDSVMTEIYIKGTEPTEYAPLDTEVTESNLSESEYND